MASPKAVRISAAANDAVEGGVAGNMGVVNLFGLYDTVASSSQKYSLGLRFTGLSELRGVTITQATLTFYASYADSGTFTSRLYIQNAASAPQFNTTLYNITDTAQRPRLPLGARFSSADPGLESWAAGSTYVYSGDVEATPVTLAQVIQQLVNAYPETVDTVVLLIIYESGSGMRRPAAYDLSAANAPLLTITYSTGGAPQTVVAGPAVARAAAQPATRTPGPVTVAVADVPGTKTVACLNSLVTPVVLPLGRAAAVATARDSSLTTGGVVRSPSAVGLKTTVYLPAAVAQRVIVGDVPGLKATVAAPTITPGLATVLAPVAVAKAAVKAPTILSPVVLTMPTPPAVKTVGRGAILTPGGVIRIPSPAPILARLPDPTLLAPQAICMTPVGAPGPPVRCVVREIDGTKFPAGTVFYLEGYAKTDAAASPVWVRLYNVTDGSAVAASQTSSVNTSMTRIRSSGMTAAQMGCANGPKLYRCEFGGKPGATYEADPTGWAVIWEVP